MMSVGGEVMNTIILLVSIFLTCWMGPIIVARVCHGDPVYAGSFIIFALGLTGVGARFFGVY